MTFVRNFHLLALCCLCAMTSCTRKPNIALGTLERERVVHTATANEIVIATPVSVGKFVEKGTVLVRLDNQLQTALVEQAKANVAKAEAYLDKLHNGARLEEVESARALVEGAKASLLDVEKNYIRTQELAKQKLISQVNMDQIQAQRDSARAILRNTQQQLQQLTNGTREEDLRMAQSELKATQAVLKSELHKLQNLTVVASRSGVLDSLPWNLGERVSMGSPLAVVLAGEVPYARVYIPATVRVKVVTGSQLTVTVEGQAESLLGTVRWVSSDPAFTPYYALNQQERSRLVYLAEIDLPSSAAQLPNGVPVQVVIP